MYEKSNKPGEHKAGLALALACLPSAKEHLMKRRKITRPVLGLTVALVGLMSWVAPADTNNPHELTPSSQALLFAYGANGKIAFSSSEI